jgi:MFS family permease
MCRQPKAVLAVAFACVVAFMGIGLVDPVLKPIGDSLHASPSQTALLFTSYMAAMGVAMLVTGVVASRIGPKPTLLLGLVVIGAGAGLAGMSDTVLGIVGWRALWGLGNALFVATALATIVNSARRSVAQAIIFYEAALGLGIAVGPLVGGVLGAISWRGPFFGVSALMAVAFIVIGLLLPATPRAERATTLADPFRALRHRGLRGVAITALLCNFGCFILVAFAPFPLGMGAHQIGLIFFGWGTALAFSSVVVAPRLQHRFGTVPTLWAGLVAIAVMLAVMAIEIDTKAVLVTCVVVAGLFMGITNTLITATVMKAAPVDRGVASAAYSFVRFSGAALAPWVAGVLGERIGMHVPFWVGAVTVAPGCVNAAVAAGAGRRRPWAPRASERCAAAPITIQITGAPTEKERPHNGAPT